MLSIQYQIMVLTFSTLLGIALGFLVQGWRLKASHATSLAECTERYHALELSIEKQNGSIALMGYKLEVAEDDRKKAEANAAYIRTQYTTQTKKADNIVASTCNAMVENLKGVQ